VPPKTPQNGARAAPGNSGNTGCASPAIIDGSHYVLKPHAEGYPSGLCGATNLIKFNDGHEVACDNLWFQGEIPDCWKDRMPDNAKFV